MVSLGLGITLGSFFLALGGVAAIYIRAYFGSKDKKNNNGSNGYIRKGEHNQGLEKIETRLGSIEKKLDDINSYICDHDSKINDLGQRAATIETVQRMCPYKAKNLEEVK